MAEEPINNTEENVEESVSITKEQLKLAVKEQIEKLYPEHANLTEYIGARNAAKQQEEDTIEVPDNQAWQAFQLKKTLEERKDRIYVRYARLKAESEGLVEPEIYDNPRPV